MGRKTFILIMLISMGAGYLFYYYIPAFWQLDCRWDVLTGDDISKERVQQYHQAWLQELKNNNIDQFIKEHQCTLSATQWNCSYIASDFHRFTQLKEQADTGYQKVSGWVDPMLLRQELQKFDQQETVLQENLALLQKEIDAIEKKIAPRRKKIEAIVQKRDLYQQNLELRKRQIDLYNSLLPAMDEASELYKVYSEKMAASKTRIFELSQKIELVDLEIKNGASDWITLAEMVAKKEQWSADIQNLQTRNKEYLQALQSLHDGKAPHPREYAFLLKEQQFTPIRQAGVLFPAFLTVLLLFSNLWIAISRFFAPPKTAVDDLTMVDMDPT